MNIGKKLLSLLTVFCLTLSLVPTMALAAEDTTRVTVGETSVVGSSTTYYLNNGTTSGLQNGSENNYNVKYEPDSHTLTLNNYSGGLIWSTGNLIISLNGTNYITSGNNGIYSGGKLTINGPGSLILTSSTNGTTVYAKDTITIQNGAKVTAPGGTSGQSIHLNTDGKQIIITGSGTVVNAIDGSTTGIIRCGLYKSQSTVYTGEIHIRDGAKLQATKIEGKLIINDVPQNLNNGNLTNNEASASTEFKISGTVKDGQKIVEGASVQLAPTGTADASAVISTSTMENGTYSFSNVPAGTYTIQASKDGYTSATSQSVTVESADVTDTNLTLSLIKYNVYVNGTQVTGLNKGNVLASDTNNSGKVSYTPAGEGTPAKLTLSGVNLTSSGILTSEPLVIELQANTTNTISVSGHAINMHQDTSSSKPAPLEITGTGTLNVTGSSQSSTLYAYGDVTINGGANVTAINTNTGLGDALDLTQHHLTISGDSTTLLAQKSGTAQGVAAINNVNTLTVDGGATLTAQSGNKAVVAQQITYPTGATISVDKFYNNSGANLTYEFSNLSNYKYMKVETGSGVATTKEATPNATFTATGPDCGTLSDVSNGMQYKVGEGSTWESINSTSKSLSGLSNGSIIYIKTPGNGSTTSDSDTQTITISKASVPSGLTAQAPNNENSSGKIIGTAATMEYQLNGHTAWNNASENEIKGLAAGTYNVRVKASGNVLASDSVSVIVPFGYGVWVGNTQITSANKGNVQTGVTYNPATKTLTLNGATITGAANRAYTSAINDACGIYSTHALTINLVGSNTVSGAETSPYGNYGIFVSGKLTFTSDRNGSIIVSGGASTNNGNAWVPGVYASGITVNNCNVTASGGTAEGDNYPVSYAMSTAPTLIGVEVTMANTENREPTSTLEYNKSKNSTYKYLQITKKTNADTTVADPVIEPESGYFTGSVAVKMSCLTNGTTIYYTTDGSEPTTRNMKYTNDITLNETKTIKAIAVKGDQQSQIVTATFTKRDSTNEVTEVTLSLNNRATTLPVGITKEGLKATVKHNETTINDVSVTWTSDNPDVATVDASGKITAKELGKARITASVTENGTTFSDFCDVIVTAKTQVAITFNANGGTVSPATANTNAYGKLDNLPTPTRSGYSFDGWYTEAEGGTAVTTDTVFDKATTIYAHWTRNSSSGSHTTYYPVNTPAKSEGGSVVVSQKSASKGSAVTVTVTPESGYQVSSVQAVDKVGKKLTLTDKGDGKYSFVMPGSKVEVSASFAQVQKPEEPSPYRDVSKDSYYYDAVQWASNKGITNGVADGVFAPDWVCTRGQIVTFLWRSVGSPASKTAEIPFADVAEDAYYAQAVLWAVENGITKGTSETTFSPDQTCTRAHAVAFLYRLAGSPAVTGSSFQDVAADAYYNAAVAWAVQQGITKGTSETTFSPNETCTRAQIVTFLYRMDQAK